MSFLDIICIAIIVIAAIRCTFRGFITEVMSMAALILGIVVAIFFSKAGAVLVDTYIGYSRWNQIVAFLILFVVVYLVVKLIERMLHSLLERIRLERLDRALGLFLGIVEGCVVVFLIVYLLRVQPIFDATVVLEESFIADLVLDVVPIFAPGSPAVQPAAQPVDV